MYANAETYTPEHIRPAILTVVDEWAEDTEYRYHKIPVKTHEENVLVHMSRSSRSALCEHEDGTMSYKQWNYIQFVDKPMAWSVFNATDKTEEADEGETDL